ncbi:hypothetical protein [Sphingomonas aerophila]|uniref:Uncharacterized protein n=1 Tax=Sphingomonas aerophila TaxID=1344948 RepID=A0A7W9EW68_9SPHN|nr:hypothetical protein [Sphingomonas aerophila]MBB5716990.1 hypothetical protein [Sphingomonas aerophila]
MNSMIQRRLALCGAALALIIVDSFWFYEEMIAPNATITHVGLDFFELILPKAKRAARLRAGKWDVSPLLDPEKSPFGFVSLEPEGTYGQAILSIRALKAQHVCNVLIRDAGKEEGKLYFSDRAEDALRIPSLSLCGISFGHGGFSGKLSSDGPIHIG